MAAVSRETHWVVFCTLAAFLRIASYSTAFPLFIAGDEAHHFDAIHKYSHGLVTGAIQPFTPAVNRIIALHASPEGRWGPEFFANGEIPAPLWRLDEARREAAVSERARTRDRFRNCELTHPPVFYLIMAAWSRLGELLGLRDGRLVYWLRFFCAAIWATLVPFGALWAKRLFPERPFDSMAIAGLIAFYPHDTFYAVQNDVLTPLLFGAAFTELARLEMRPDAGFGAHLRAGALVAATLLAKLSTVAIVVVLSLVAWRKLWRSAQARDGCAIRRVAVMLAAAALPVLGWGLWNLTTFGDLTGGGAKAAFLGWTHRPLGAYLAHPLFTWGGAVAFLGGNLVDFWRGAYTWHGVVLRHRFADAVYAGSTLFFFAAAAWALQKKAGASASDRRVHFLGAAALGGSLLFLAGLSVFYDFPISGTRPTRELPLLIDGRLLLCVLVPFLLLYLRGLGEVCARFRISPAYVLSPIILVAAISELLLIIEPLRSQYNWYGLPSP